MQEKKKDISPVKRRILEFIESKGITLYKCYKDTGISKNILSQKNGLSEENLVKFLVTYKDINPIWVVLGEGNMYRSDSSKKSVSQEKEDIEDKIQDITPDLLLRRFEELVIENNELKRRLSHKKNEVPSLRASGSAVETPKAQTELK